MARTAHVGYLWIVFINNSAINSEGIHCFFSYCVLEVPMKSISLIFGLFVFFVTIVLSMVWFIHFQIQGDRFLYHSKQIHRTLSLQCIHQGCTTHSLQQDLNLFLIQTWPDALSKAAVIKRFNLDPFLLEIELKLRLNPIGPTMEFEYSKIMIGEKQ